MIGIGIANSFGVNLSGLNPATKSFVTSAGISDPNTVLAINNLINGLQADGIWNKMKAIYPFATDNRNLLGYTEDFSNAIWSKGGGTTVTANSSIAPDGTTTADTIVIPNNGTIAQPLVTATSQTFTLSIYLRASANTTIKLGFVSPSIVTTCNVTTTWQRFTITHTFTGTTFPQLYNDSGSSVTLFAWGAQVDLGATASTYQRISTTQQAYISNQFKFNLVNPVDSDAAFRLVFNGGWTHSSTGALPNGTNGYADTKFNQENNWTSNINAAFGFYSRTDSANSSVDIGALTNSISGTNGSAIYSRYGSNVIFSAANSAGVASIANANSLGFFIASRNNSTQHKIYKFGTTNINTTQTSALSTNINRNIYLGAANDLTLGSAASYSLRQQAFAFMSDGLNDTEVTNLNTRVQAFQTTLSRQV